MNFFGRKKGSTTKTASTTAGSGGGGETPLAKIARMKKTCENLEKREDLLLKKIQTLNKQAKEKSKSGNRQAALIALKRRKLLEKELDKVAGSRLNVESIIMSVEAASVNVDVVQSIQAGKTAMQKINKANDIERVEDLIDDIAEATQLADEVSDVLGNPIGAIDDEDDLLAELEGLDDMDLEADGETDAAAVPDSTDSLVAELKALESNLPSAPKNKVHVAVEEDDDDAALRRLQAELEMS